MSTTLLKKLYSKSKITGKAILDMGMDPLKKTCVSINKPIFIWGMGRGGTTLLMDMVSLHPDLCFVKGSKERMKKGLWGYLHHGEDTNEKLINKSVPVEGMLANWDNAGINPDFPKGIFDQSMADEVDKSIVLKNYRSLATTWKWADCIKTYRIMDKAPAYIMMVGLIDKIFPDSYHIFCIRDPRAVLNSYLRLIRFTAKDTAGLEYNFGIKGYNFPGLDKLRENHLIEILTWQLKQIVELGRRHKQDLGERVVMFNYEELLLDSHKAMKTLFARVELADYPELENIVPLAFPDYSPEWPAKEDEFSASEKICFNSSEMKYMEEVESLALELGYDKNKVGKLNAHLLYS